MIKELLQILLSGHRRKKYQKELDYWKVKRTNAPVLGTQIRPENDHSESFKRW